MPLYRVIAAVNTAPNHYDGYRAGDTLALVTAHARALAPIMFTIDADDAESVLDEMWALGNRVRDDRQGRRWPADVRSLSTGDVLLLHRPGDQRAAELALAFAVAPSGFTPISLPDADAWVALEGSTATSRPAPTATAAESARELTGPTQGLR